MHLDEFRRSYEGFVKLMCRIDSVPLPQHAEMRIAGRLLDTWQKVISDRIVELHFERSTDFGQDVECNAENTAGADSKRERIPCKFRFQILNLMKLLLHNYRIKLYGNLNAVFIASFHDLTFPKNS